MVWPLVRFLIGGCPIRKQTLSNAVSEQVGGKVCGEGGGGE